MVAAGAVKEEEEELEPELGPEQEELEQLLAPQPVHLAAVAQGVASLVAVQDEVEGAAGLLEGADESVVVVAERRATRSTKPVLAGLLPPASRRRKIKKI